MTGRTTIRRAVEGYDEEFRDVLLEKIMIAIGKVSIATDAPVMAIRTGETVDALVFLPDQLYRVIARSQFTHFGCAN